MKKTNTIINKIVQRKKKRKAFTLVEVMLMLLVLSLIVASSTAMITRKHKLKPRKAIHGQYGCFKVRVDNSDDSDNPHYYTHEYMQSGQSILYHRTDDPSYPAANYKSDLHCSPELPRSTG